MKVFVAGGSGFVGRRVCAKLRDRRIEFVARSRRDGLDCLHYDELLTFARDEGVDYLVDCAAMVGGIQYGVEHPAEMYLQNLRRTLNFLELSRELGLKRVVNPIANCAYPAQASLFREEEIWDGPLHESVLAYGSARRSTLVGAWAYNRQYGTDWVNLVLPNMYGPGDHFEEKRSHALGALVMKFVEAKHQGWPEVTVWGTGSPVREWLYVDDGAEALVRALDIAPYVSAINVGVGKGISIGDLARLIRERVRYTGEIVFDTSKPDGAAYKTMEGSLGSELLGWQPSTTLEEGISNTVAWYEESRQGSQRVH